jgi:hypothetical protein
MFVGDECIFGQCGAAQSHLRNQGVGIGDVFLFFGLFADKLGGERHHRIFGYLVVRDVLPIAGPNPALSDLPRPHPHTLGTWNTNNTVYRGRGAMAEIASDRLRLTVPGGPLQQWTVPSWLRPQELTFHGKPERWLDDGSLRVVARGQEFVASIDERPEPRAWLADTLNAIHT